MKTKVSNFTEFRAYYLSEFELYDGEAFITFNIVGIDLDRNEVQVVAGIAIHRTVSPRTVFSI